MASERQLIERVRRALPPRGGAELCVGIGDDAAVIRPRGPSDWVVTTDGFLENVHFLPGFQPAISVGYKALARATSDLAAMGAWPRYFLLSLALPEVRTGAWLNRFLRGMARAARRFGLELAGGDTTRSPQIAINITVLGQIARGRAVLRSGARPGDLLCVSGTLGEAELGLQALVRGFHKQKQSKSLLRKHFQPEPRVALGRWLSENRIATAMIDLSDGLSTDLEHLCEASGVGARVWAERLIKPRVPAPLRKLNVDPLALALHGGDDYELLFTVAKRAARRLPPKFQGLPITVIGETTRQTGMWFIDPSGRRRILSPRGWDPFRRRD